MFLPDPGFLLAQNVFQYSLLRICHFNLFLCCSCSSFNISSSCFVEELIVDNLSFSKSSFKNAVNNNHCKEQKSKQNSHNRQNRIHVHTILNAYKCKLHTLDRFRIFKALLLNIFTCVEWISCFCSDW